MAVQTPAVPTLITDDATYRQFVTAVHDAIVAVGLVNTADTGQIDEDTALRPVTTNTDGGYKIYRFDDAKQATAPWFIKVIYGRGSNTNVTRLRVAVGTGTDGAGTLTGQVSDFALLSHTAACAPAAHISGAANRLGVVYGNNFVAAASSNFYAFWVERGRDPDGSENNDCVLFGGPPFTPTFAYVPAVGEVPAPTSAVPALMPAGTTGAYGGDIGVYPITPVVGPNVKGPMLGVLSYLNADFGLGVELNGVEHLGAARNYKALAGGAMTAVVNGRLAILNQ